MSTLSVDKVEPVGSTLTFGESGDTFVIPVGATFTNNGAATGFAAGSTHASQWRLTTDFTASADPITSNLEQVDAPVGFGVLGAGMTMNASGVFTFPVTGYWSITAFGAFGSFTLASAAAEIMIYSTINDSTWAEAAKGLGGVYYANNTAVCSYIMDVTDVTQCKVRFRVYQSSASVTTRGDTAFNETHFSFNRLADT